MSAAVLAPPTTGTGTVFLRAAGAEWVRLRTVRTTWACLLAAAVVIVGLGAIAAADEAEGTATASNPVVSTFAGEYGVLLGQFGLLVLALLAVTQEYASGSIGPTLQWTPRRGVLLAARVVVPTVAVTVIGVLLALVADLVALLIDPELTLPLGDAVAGLARIAAVLVAGSLLAVGVGLLLRSTAAGLATVFLLQLVLPFLMQSFNVGWLADLAEWLPGTGAVRTLLGEPDSLSLGGALALLACWSVAAVAAGSWRLLRRDAG
ncbi:ABC-2 type transport system permease protein [Blastococcus fimeti]|nr:ABC-2 type transport system permease protein [Blastococcus fimeti]